MSYRCPKKMLQVFDQEEMKLFYKEIRLLNDLHHPNIVRLIGVSVQPLAMMLEYMYFDFKQFGHDRSPSPLGSWSR